MDSAEYLDSIRPIEWRDGALHVIDQRRLPEVVQYVALHTCADVVQAIRDMLVRGAPAIGLSAAYGAVLAARETYAAGNPEWKRAFETCLVQLEQARPTAVNLMWAVQQAREWVTGADANPEQDLLALADRLFEADLAANRCMGELGAELIEPVSGVLTHCNAGALATAGYGTALGVIRSAWQQQRLDHVYAGETRPWNQGARLTVWELNRDRIPVSLVADSAAASLMRQQRVRWVIVGADRITANGDVVNKIGTYSLAILARHHGVRFMVVAPTSTFDWSLGSGSEVPIETRDERELLPGHYQTVDSGPSAWNPVFDVTPAELIDVIVTEKGVVMDPDPSKMAAFKKELDV